jgi:hypothetical protein
MYECILSVSLASPSFGLTHVQMRLLLDLVPVLLVEPGRVPRAGRPHADVPLGGRLARHLLGRAQGEAPERVLPLPLPHHLQVCPLLLCLSETDRSNSCAKTCPKGLNPAKAISALKQELVRGMTARFAILLTLMTLGQRLIPAAVDSPSHSAYRGRTPVCTTCIFFVLSTLSMPREKFMVT